MRAASPIASGSQPASCNEVTPASIWAIRMVVRLTRTIAHDAIISDTTSPAPSERASLRNGRSVTPDIGATTTGVSIRTPPPRSMQGRPV